GPDRRRGVRPGLERVPGRPPHQPRRRVPRRRLRLPAGGPPGRPDHAEAGRVVAHRRACGHRAIRQGMAGAGDDRGPGRCRAVQEARRGHLLRARAFCLGGPGVRRPAGGLLPQRRSRGPAGRRALRPVGAAPGREPAPGPGTRPNRLGTDARGPGRPGGAPRTGAGGDTRGAGGVRAVVPVAAHARSRLGGRPAGGDLPGRRGAGPPAPGRLGHLSRSVAGVRPGLRTAVVRLRAGRVEHRAGPRAVGQLLALLKLTGRVGNTSKVVDRLKTYLDTMPYEVAQCIAVLVANERGSITILGWGQDAQQMLSRIVGGSDARARDIALDLLDTFDLQPVTELIRWS